MDVNLPAENSIRASAFKMTVSLLGQTLKKNVKDLT